MRVGGRPVPANTQSYPPVCPIHHGSVGTRSTPTYILLILWRVSLVNNSTLLTRIIRKLHPPLATLCNQTCRLSRPLQGNDDCYVSNVCIIFDCSILLYYPLWMFMGFTLHFYIIFGTNLLTGGPARIAGVFCLFQCSEEKECQTESKRNETFGIVIFWKNIILEAWRSSQKTLEEPRR